MFESLGFTLPQLEMWLLLLARFATLLSVLPFFSYDSFNAQMRALLAVILASVMVKIVPYPSQNFPVEFTILIFYTAREVLVGLCIGMFCGFFTEAVKFGGRQVSHMMGFDMAQLMDPTTSEETPVVSEMFHIFAILLILSINGHHFFLKIMFDSVYHIPISTAHFSEQLVPQMTALISNVIIIGVRIAAPAMVIILLIRVVVGIMNRLVQDADVFSVLIVINIYIGLYILKFFWPYFAQMVNFVYTVTQNQVLMVLRMLR